MVFIGACLFIPLIIALVYGEHRQAGAFLISILICIMPGILTQLFFKRPVIDEKLSIRDGYLIVVGAWLLASVFGALPYILTGVTTNFFHAFFETVSGFSTTGATVFSKVEELPHCILIWRALTQWLGGMGIIVLFFALIPDFGAKANVISKNETPGPIKRRLTSRFSDTAQKLYMAYIALTIILFLLLLLGKMSVFDAFAHSLSTMATGGFSTHSGGLAYFNSTYIYLVIAIFAFLAASNFLLIYDIIEGRLGLALKDDEYKSYLITIIFFTILITISQLFSNDIDNQTGIFSSSLFQVLNTISTLGFETGNSNWPSFSILLLMLLMIMGGCSSSTSGGVKVIRVQTFFKSIKRELSYKTQNSMVNNVRLNGKKLQDETVNSILAFFILYLTVIVIATSMISAVHGGDILVNFISILSCISNLGPGFNNLGHECQYFTDSPFCIMIYSFVMIAGRLELTSFLVLFTKHFWNPYCV